MFKFHHTSLDLKIYYVLSMHSLLSTLVFIIRM
jgi:hypothetical protein